VSQVQSAAADWTWDRVELNLPSGRFGLGQSILRRKLLRSYIPHFQVPESSPFGKLRAGSGAPFSSLLRRGPPVLWSRAGCQKIPFACKTTVLGTIVGKDVEPLAGKSQPLTETQSLSAKPEKLSVLKP